MQPNKMIVEKQCEMGRPLGKDEWRQTSKESRGEKTSTIQEGKPQQIYEDCLSRDMRRNNRKSGSTILHLTLNPVQR